MKTFKDRIIEKILASNDTLKEKARKLWYNGKTISEIESLLNIKIKTMSLDSLMQQMISGEFQIVIPVENK